MPQGKLKVKTKLPVGTKAKKKPAGKKTGTSTKRHNRPVPPKKAQLVEAQKLKKTMSKNINMIMEEDLRQKALEGRQSISGRKRSAPSPEASSSVQEQEDGPKKKKKRKN